MRDILPTLKAWNDSGQRFSLAWVVKTWGSSPRPVGSVMGIREDGVVCGSVSAGCIESSVIESALSRNEPHSLHFDSITNEKAWEVGLSCGGEVEVWIHPGPGPCWSLMTTLLEEDEPFVLCTDLEPFQQSIWRPGDPGEDQAEAFRMRQSGLFDRTFLNVMPGRDRLIVVGAVHTAKPLVAMAHEMGFETLIIDPRKALAESEQFDPAPGKIIQGWPHDVLPQIRLTEDTYAVVLTHDPKIDDPALEALLRSPVAYVGALGSRQTQADRRNRLFNDGFTASEVDRIHGPVGLDIGSRTPAEIALSILAEIIQVKRTRG